MTDYAIKTSDLSKDFGSVLAVDHLTIQVPAGIVFGFLGQNGAGKTTTIHLLLGLIGPTNGEAQVLGYEVRSQADQVRERCGVLLEYKGLYERLTALDNLEYFGRIWHLPAAERQERNRELLTHFDLWERRNDKVVDFSKGMKAKLAVARTLIHRPPLIFLDEPTEGLDPVAAVSLRDDLVRLASKEKVTVFLTSHNMPEVEKICSQIGIIRKGRLIAFGSPGDISTDKRIQAEVFGHGFNEVILENVRKMPEVQDAVLVGDHLLVDMVREDDLAKVVTEIVRQGGQVGEVKRVKQSLEDAYVQLMEEEQ
jgi:ABC-2 type transport system ATP-binding protein